MRAGSPQARALYSKKELEFKEVLQQSKQYIKNMEEEIKKNEGDNFNLYRTIAVANEYLNMVSLYIQITEDMESLKGVKNETYLNEGRKAFYSVMLNIEKIFTDIINLEPTEIQENVEKVSKFDPARKIILFRKMGFILDRLQNSFGENSKYKWAFTDMFARYAVIVKNSMNIKMLSTRDPRKPFFEENEVLVNMLVELLTRAADRIREKYELASQKFEDMNKAIRILDELRRFQVLLGDQSGAEDAKKKMAIWNDKLEKDLKKQEQMEAKKRQKPKKKGLFG